MSTQLLFRQLRYIFAAIFLALSLLALAGQTLTTARAARAARQHITTGSTYVVNSTDDLPDADVGDPGSSCAAANGKCTLRAAIMQANFVTGLDTITVPSGVYVLTRSGNDDAAVLGDLDIADDLTIQGAGSGLTIVDGNGAVTSDRVFQVLASAKETSFSGLTIRNGKKVATFDEGGGLYWEGGGGHLRLHDVLFESNTAYYGGGLYMDYSSLGGSIELDNISVRANTASTAAGGGLVAALNGPISDFALRNSQIYNNAAFQGGGIYLQGTPAPFSDFFVRIENSEVYSNTASHGAGIDNASGDADHPLMILDSHLHHNHAASIAGAIENNGSLSLISTTLDLNSAGTQGGGLYNSEPQGQVNLLGSTLNGNSAQFGAGIYSAYFSSFYDHAAMTITNSTLSDNIASRVGGGIDAEGGRIKLFNSTIADNRVVVPRNIPDGGLGGGVLITGTGVIVVQNALIADNTDSFHGGLPVADDCYDLAASYYLYSFATNLIEATSYCNIDGNTSAVISGQSPKLGPLQNNGGSTWTRSPLTGSPAIDNGDNTACPPMDQRGWRRLIGVSCDIGAVEVGLFGYLPLIRR